MRIKGWCSIDENASFLRASGNVLILRLDYERGENWCKYGGDMVQFLSEVSQFEQSKKNNCA